MTFIIIICRKYEIKDTQSPKCKYDTEQCLCRVVLSAQNNNNNSQIGIATSVRPGAVVTTTITTIVSQNPCQTVITSTSYSTNSLKAAPTNSLAATKSGTSFTNLTTCNPQYLRSMQSSSYHRRHSVSGIVTTPTTLTYRHLFPYRLVFRSCRKENPIAKTKQTLF